MRSNVLTKINILSTPIARTRNGITSAIMRVVLIPMADMIPNEMETEERTRRIPAIPRENFEDVTIDRMDQPELKLPSDTAM
jgi:hypothetical protein